ncbi:DNA-binding protein [Bacillus phage vB_BanS_Chewbecca]|uniref:DNA-binding protein n=4 Tax=Caudoviricetes TaxID=2731619 RepID=A0AAE8YVQ6_9CAUD|nr:DNA-binding protein [Bacillus phage vB_BanS_Skywalker]YP_010681117.1 DNA binding protein [Bacillus phage vB_BanS_MrDarsey]YP_010681355.1 DNA-binding protein [Bacillus phage vB_BanS_Chewbecca]UGO46295.1 DNA-binding protein [Bacillus phage vB_BanS_Chewbecca]UGO48053.1 DNA binding protein [Bacillus phage vB_BanS_MrDarsey]UGO51205.1 DNA-binding protein [Bacillus phage vB_BanS_Skywalker]
MKVLNLTELIHEVWKDKRVRELKIRKSEVKVIVKVAVEHMVTGLLQYGKLKVMGLFTLDIRKAKGRRMRHPQTGEIMHSKDYHKVGLEPSKKLKDGLKKFKR